MIRFSCPGCEAVFNVSDDKAGKTGKCPKCSSQFTIPEALGSGTAPVPAPALAPPPPPAAGGASVEIAPCPKCGARLSVEAGDIGLEVECPTCRAVYPAETAVAVKPRNPGGGSGQKKSLAVPEPDDEEERPSRRRAVARDDDDEDRPSRRSRRDEEDDEEDERPRKKRRRRRSAGMESKRIGAVLLCFFGGNFGAHKFYLGYTNAGLILLIGNLCTCYLLFWIIPLIEMFIYLTKSDEDFIETYQIGQKEWF